MDLFGMDDLKEFMLGALVMGNLTVAVFFIRYWKVTADRFFLFFAWSFAFGALSRVIRAGNLVGSESEPLIYVVRLLSYLVILMAIIDKNRTSIRKMLFQRT